MSFFSCVSCCMAVPWVLGIFFETHQIYGFIGLHDLAKQLRCKQLGVVSKHDFFLYAAVGEGSSSEILVGEVSLETAIVVLDACVVRCHFQRAHWFLLMFCDYFLDAPVFYLPLDNKGILIALNFIDFWFDILKRSDRLVGFVLEDVRKVHHVVVPASLLDALIELLPRDQAEHHRAKQVENFLFAERVLLTISWFDQWDIHARPLQQKLGNFGVNVFEFLLVLSE